MNQNIFMTKFPFTNNLLLLSILPLFSVLTACQSLRPPKLPSVSTTTIPATSTNSNAGVTQPIHFSITGKIGVRTSKQSGSAFYAWSQAGERFAIDLTGALGIGQTHIEGIPNHVSLQSAKTGYIEASTPEELLQHATGWQAPISYLPHWIDGQSVNAVSEVTRDSKHRLLTLNEGGWDVAFNYDDQANSQYPNRLIMNQITKQSSEQLNSPTQNNRVILTIQREADNTTDPTTTTSTAP